MKKITSSIVAAMAVGTFAFAGGDIAPVEPVVETPAVVESTGNFYVGAAYSYGKIEDVVYSDYVEYDEFIAGTHDQNALLLLAGYNFNQYIGIEGRYTLGIGDADSDIVAENFSKASDATDFSNLAVYIKPMYPVTEEFTIYGLLGYGQTTYTYATLSDGGDYIVNEDTRVSGFQYGAGLSYALSENLSLFADYTKLADEDGNYDYIAAYDSTTQNGDDDLYMIDSKAYTINFGVTYTF